MNYALKLLFFVLVAGGAASFLLRPVFAGLLTPAQYKRAWVSLLTVTVIAFLSFQPALYLLLLAIAACVLARYLGPGNLGKVNTFMLFLLPLPPIHSLLGGVEGINYVMLLDHSRVLSLVLLAVPAVALLFRQRRPDEPSMRSVDIAMLLFQLWGLALLWNSAGLTTIARSLATSLCDVLIPYYVITRTLRTPEQIRLAASHLMLGCLFMASVAVLEALMQRNLYAGLQWIYGQRWESTVDLRRGAFLRVDSAAPQPIVLGFCMVFGLGLWAWLSSEAPRNKATRAVYLLLAFALWATWSRGPWLGAALLGIALLLQRWLPARPFGLFVVGAVIAAAVFKSMGGDETVIAGLSALFGGESDISTIVYRRDLFDATVALIKQSPWTGVPNYQSGLESFRQGEGIIDIVNTYLAIMINGGVIGLVLYLLPYLLVLAKLLGASARQPGASRFPPVFIALILAMLFVIFTVSSIGIIPYLLGLGIAFPVAWLRQLKGAALQPATVQRTLPSSESVAPGPVEERPVMRY